MKALMFIMVAALAVFLLSPLLMLVPEKPAPATATPTNIQPKQAADLDSLIEACRETKRLASESQALAFKAIRQRDAVARQRNALIWLLNDGKVTTFTSPMDGPARLRWLNDLLATNAAPEVVE